MSGTNSEKGEMERGDEKEKRLRRPRMQKKEVAECSGRKGRGQRRKEIRRWWCRWEGGRQTGEKRLRRGGVKSGDLQVQPEQPVTLMVH